MTEQTLSLADLLLIALVLAALVAVVLVVRRWFP